MCLLIFISGISYAGQKVTGVFSVGSSASVEGDHFIVDNNGNVGVGTATPQSAVDIYGNVLISQQGTFMVGGSTTFSQYLFRSTATDPNSSYLNFQIDSRVTPTSATSLFYAGLQVQAQSLGSNNLTGSYGSGGLVGTIYKVVHAGSGTVSNAYGLIPTVQNTGSGAITNGYALYVPNCYKPTGNINNCYGLYLENQSSGGTSNTSLYSAGKRNLFGGIDVFDPTNPIVYIRNSNATISGGETIGTIAFYTDDVSGITNRVAASIAAVSAGAFAGDSAPTSLTFNVHSSGTVLQEAVRVTSTQRVGVNQISPSATLDIRGLGTTTGLAFRITNSATAAKLNVLDNGNVGIGAINPQTSLQILKAITAGSTQPSLILDGTYGSLASVNAIDFTINSGITTPGARIGAPVLTGNKGELALYTNANYTASNPTERVRITGAGNVGIGTTTPITTMQISGTFSVSGESTFSSHIMFTQSSQPTVYSCGTSPIITTKSTDNVGEVTWGTGTPTSCTIFFANSFPLKPHCIIQAETATPTGVGYTSTTTSFTMTTASPSASGVFDWICFGDK